MMPFLDKRKAVAAIAAKMKGGQVKDEPVQEENMEDMGIHQVAQELIDAVHAKDVGAVATALKAAFDVFEEEPDASV